MRDERKRRRRGFTLIELLMVLAIIGVLASVLLVALYAAAQVSAVRRTEQQVERIHSLLMRRWNSYEHRRLPVRLTGNADERSAQRLMILRELMRMEMPDRISDLVYDPVDLRLLNNVLWSQYRRSAGATWTTPNESAECLYLILASIQEGDRTGLDFFTEDEIGDTDEDGMNEILDGWGKPIAFLRWAPGFSIAFGPDGTWGRAGVDDDGNGTTDDLSERGWPGSDDFVVSQRNIPFADRAPDPFDLLDADTWSVGVDGEWGDAGSDDNGNIIIDDIGERGWTGTDDVPRNTFALYPLIFSAGPDGIFDIFFSLAPPDEVPPTALMTPPNDPFHLTLGTSSRPTMQIGTPYDREQDGNNSFDNITNH